VPSAALSEEDDDEAISSFNLRVAFFVRASRKGGSREPRSKEASSQGDLLFRSYFGLRASGCCWLLLDFRTRRENEQRSEKAVLQGLYVKKSC